VEEGRTRSNTRFDLQETVAQIIHMVSPSAELENLSECLDSLERLEICERLYDLLKIDLGDLLIDSRFWISYKTLLDEILVRTNVE